MAKTDELKNRQETTNAKTSKSNIMGEIGIIAPAFGVVFYSLVGFDDTPPISYIMLYLGFIVGFVCSIIGLFRRPRILGIIGILLSTLGGLLLLFIFLRMTSS